MLEIARPTAAFVKKAQHTEGAFLWWYADLRGSAGEGLVLIWSLGLPFLPGSRSRELPGARPSMSIAHYQDGRQRLYLLQQYGDGDACIDAETGCGTIGRSRYEIIEGDEEVELRAVLDEPIASSGDRLTGTITLRGPRVRLESTAPDAVHAWQPLSVHAHGRADLRAGDESIAVEGPSYLDSNVSLLPLQGQKIRSWRWGRVSFTDSSLVYYEVEEDDGNRRRYIVRQGQDGRFSAVPGHLSFSDEQRSRYGLVSPRVAALRMSGDVVRIKTEKLVEDGPFYQRFLVVAEDGSGQRGCGTSEVVVPGRVDQRWQRPFVRMKTHRVGRKNSPWLPLFSGPPLGRTTRLLRSLSGWGRGA